ncbi:A/G-specific adenine glycosylase [Methylovorus menthalis]|uniref:A/G-specific adenine glycosylase n=1 Tax=Methylovorus menthalis TaxID=1002227 RepID=UPI001E582753|nr:A/G-specific adenine glycosylase [Methylovorus menthalis]MCB4809866.1 A/G-specific adenine glycosylase [Methylovorus menthalis]
MAELVHTLAQKPAGEDLGAEFASRLIAWQKRYGRHDLPWQQTRDPYAIWVSEIMLQQTQVAAVIGYYQRFMQRFPTIASLATATQDDVMQHWSGLGYYSRARNLHKAAQQVMQEHGGVFPQTLEAIQALPGIGRSTASAIASFAFEAPHPILDGNVKRVFARHFAIEGWPGLPRVEQTMWALAERLQPTSEHGPYAQALMDMGATLCTRSRPRCDACPLQTSCLAYREGRTRELPASKPRKVIPEKSTTMLILLHDNQVMLEKRPASGIWGGLWSLPEVDSALDAQQAAAERYGVQTQKLPPFGTLTHVFSHFKLHILPQPLAVETALMANQTPNTQWLTLEAAVQAGIPAPVRVLLEQLRWQQTALI